MIWRPGDVFLPHLQKNYALVVLNQPLELSPEFYAKLWEQAVYHIAADGGANRLHDACKDLKLETVIGDLDSLHEAVGLFYHAKGSELIHDTDQDSTDFTKAVRYLKNFKLSETASLTVSFNQQGLDALKLNVVLYQENMDIVVLGGLGGRVDHGMATLHQLYSFQDDPKYASGRMSLLSSESITFVLKSGKHKIKVRDSSPEIALGEHIGIIPIKEPSVITTTGLRWDVTDWKTEFGGMISTSNQVKEDWVTVETTKDVLFTIDLIQPR